MLYLFFILRGAFYCLSMPVWEGYDEPYQFAAVQFTASTGTMATSATPISRQVAASLYLLPAPWMLRLHDLPAPVLSREDYWVLPVARRQQMHDELLALPPAWTNEPSSPVIGNYEGQQAPLYFHLVAPVERRLAGASLPSQVLLLRLTGLLVSSIAVPIGYVFARVALSSQHAALLATALAVSLPELIVNLCRVSNETAAFVLATLLLLLAVRFVQSQTPERWLPPLALTLAVALLTKAYFLTLVPALVALAFIKLSSSDRWRNILPSAFASLAILGAIAGPWYWRVHRTTGSWSGQGDDAALGHISRLALLEQAVHVNWRSGLASILLSHIWFGGWSFLRLSAWVYGLVLLLLAVAVAGVVRYLWQIKNEAWRSDPVVVIIVMYVCFWAGLCYHVLVTYVHSGVSASTGWYLYCFVFAETVLVAVGFEWIVQRASNARKTQTTEAGLSGAPARSSEPPTSFAPQTSGLGWALAGSITMFTAIDLYGMHALMLPYYAGLSAHIGDRVPPLPLGHLLRLPLALVLERLSSLGPAWLTPQLLGLSWFLYLLTTVSTVGFAVVLALRADSRVAK